MRTALALAGFTAIAACAQTVPDSGAGVGFESYGSYEAERALREAELTRSPPPSTQPAPAAPVISSEELAAAGLPASSTAVASGPMPAGAPFAGAASASPSTDGGSASAPAVTDSTAAIGPDHPRISDENDFQAVTARETIESDRERIEQNAAAYTVIQPTPVPERPGGASDPNIVAFALSTSNLPGQPLYRRSSLNAQQKFQRACASYASSDLAQIDFLKNGGPKKDRKGVDPDGDGFACAWDPTPFRLAASG